MFGLWFHTPKGDLIIAHGVRLIQSRVEYQLVLDRLNGYYVLDFQEIEAGEQPNATIVHRQKIIAPRIEKALRDGGMVDLTDLLEWPKGQEGVDF